MSSEELARAIGRIVGEKGGTNVVALDVSRILGYTDVLLICTARNERQARAIVEEVQLRLKHEHQLLARRVEGLPEGRWVLADYFDCILHVFVAETRDLYRLDQLWGEAPTIDIGSAAGPPRAVGEG